MFLKSKLLFRAICIRRFNEPFLWPILIPLKIYEFYNDHYGHLGVLADSKDGKPPTILFWIKSDKIKECGIEFDEYFIKIKEPEMSSRCSDEIESEYSKIIKTIDTESIDKLSTKWTRYHVYLKMQIEIALLLKLNKSNPLTILDIGTGAGYFPYVARYYGHQVKTTDVPGVDRNYKRITKILNVNLDYTVYITSYRKLPDFGQKFDMITMLSTIFNQHWTTMKQWNFLLDDLWQYLNPRGQLFINSNKWPSIKLLIKNDPRPIVINPYQVLYTRL